MRSRFPGWSSNRTRGLKIAVHAELPTPRRVSADVYFDLESFSGTLKIVRAFYQTRFISWTPEHSYEDPQIEAYTLQRFMLPAPPVPEQPAAVPKDDMSTEKEK